MSADAHRHPIAAEGSGEPAASPGRGFFRRHGGRLLAAWLAAAVLLSLGTGAGEPLASEATYLLMSESIRHDGDLLYRQEDLDRALRRWPAGPSGLRLERPAGGTAVDPAYAASPVYPLLALPGFALGGRAGMILVNGLLFALVGLLAWRQAGRGEERRRWGLAGFLLLSGATAHVLLPQPEVLAMLLVFTGTHLWLTAPRPGGPGRWAAAGGLLGLAAAIQPPLALVGLAALADLARRRCWRRLGVTVLAAGAALGAEASATALLTGRPPSAAREERIFEAAFPLAAGMEEKAFDDLGRSTRRRTAEPGRLLLESWYFLVGRQGGLLPCYPFALLAVLVFVLSGRGGPPLLAFALAGVCALAVWSRATAAPGTEGLLGSPVLAAAYPLFLLLAPGLTASRLLALPIVAAGLWTAPALSRWLRAGSASELVRSARLPTFRLLPQELTRFAAAERYGLAVIDGRQDRWVLPAECSAGAVEDGLRVWSGCSGEVWVVAPSPRRRLRLTTRTRAEDARLVLASERQQVAVRFDSRGKRAGTPLELSLTPRTRDLGNFFGREYYYRLTLVTADGSAPPSARGRRTPIVLEFRSDYERLPSSD